MVPVWNHLGANMLVGDLDAGAVAPEGARSKWALPSYVTAQPQ